jgi:hypothetical protein
VDGFSMKNQTFREYATTWIYLLAATDNTLAIVPCGDEFAYEFKWEPRDASHTDLRSAPSPEGRC